MNAEFVSPGTKIDLTNCEREPIHIPGAIQPHGLAIVFDQKMNVCHFSSNFLDKFSLQQKDILNCHIDSLPSSLSFLKSISTNLKEIGLMSSVNINQENFIAKRVQANPGHVFLEFESQGPEVDLVSLDSYQKLVQSISYARGELDVAQTLAASIKLLTGYDRVMIYRFDRD